MLALAALGLIHCFSLCKGAIPLALFGGVVSHSLPSRRVRQPAVAPCRHGTYTQLRRRFGEMRQRYSQD